MNDFSAVAVLAAIGSGVLFLLLVPPGLQTAPPPANDPSAAPRIGPPKGWEE